MTQSDLMILLSIDPGPEESAFVVWDGKQICLKGIEDNERFLCIVADFGANYHNSCVIEQIASYGMAVGESTFETCVYTGRFMEAFGAPRVDRIKRLEVKLHLCHDSKAKDANIRQAIIDRFGGKEKAIGKKKTPGPLYGVHADEWSALAVALTWWDKHGT